MPRVNQVLITLLFQCEYAIVIVVYRGLLKTSVLILMIYYLSFFEMNQLFRPNFGKKPIVAMQCICLWVAVHPFVLHYFGLGFGLFCASEMYIQVSLD